MSRLAHPRLIVPALLVATALPGFAAETAPTGTTRTPPVTSTEVDQSGTGAGAAGGQAVGAAIDRVLRSLHFGAYGELHYNNFQGGDSHNGQGANSTGSDMLELHRFVLLGEAEIADGWRFVTEIEIEHGFVQGNTSSNGQGELEIEQAYIDWRYHADHGARAGTMLVPISIGNIYHEPTVFHGVERPEFDRVIVPTTWYESGVAVYGKIVPTLDYTVAIQAGLMGAVSPSTGIRSARQRGYKSAADDLLYTARLDFRPLPGLWLAGAVSYGELDQDELTTARPVDAAMGLATLEARYAVAGWDLGLSLGHGRIDNAGAYPATAINNATGAGGSVPEAFTGVNATVAYDVLRLVADSAHQLFLFGRYELIDNQAELPAGRPRNEWWSADVVQYGLTYKPNPYVVIKADYRDYENDAGTAVDSWNLGAGFAF